MIREQPLEPSHLCVLRNIKKNYSLAETYLKLNILKQRMKDFYHLHKIVVIAEKHSRKLVKTF